MVERIFPSNAIEGAHRVSVAAHAPARDPFAPRRILALLRRDIADRRALEGHRTPALDYLGGDTDPMSVTAFLAGSSAVWLALDRAKLPLPVFDHVELAASSLGWRLRSLTLESRVLLHANPSTSWIAELPFRVEIGAAMTSRAVLETTARPVQLKGIGRHLDVVVRQYAWTCGEVPGTAAVQVNGSEFALPRPLPYAMLIEGVALGASLWSVDLARLSCD